MAYQIDSSGAVATLPVPVQTPGASPGFFAQINSSNTTPTVVSADFLNNQMMEIINVVQAAGITPSKTQYNQLLTAIQTLIARSARIKLTAPLTLYVSPSGNDSNAGTPASAPFLTIQAAYAALMSRYDANGQSATIQLAGTPGSPAVYTAGLNANQPNGLYTSITLLGNPTSPGSVTINLTTGACVLATFGACINCNGFTVTSGGTAGTFAPGGVGLSAYFVGLISFQNIVFGTCTNAHMLASTSGNITIPAVAANSVPYTITGGAAYHACSSAMSLVTVVGAAITLVGTPAFSGAFAFATNNAYLNFASSSFTGPATGSRYSSTNNGLIVGTGGNANYFPGSTAGSTATQGQYL